MLTTTHIDVNLGINVVIEGQSPTNNGMVSFAAGPSLRIPVINYSAGGQVRAHRLRYADLTIAGSNASYQITYSASAATGLNPVGDGVWNCLGSFAYIQSNLGSTLTGALPFIGTLYANTPYLIAGSFNPNSGFNGDDGSIIARLVWNTSQLAALGTSNFFCDIILA